MMIRTLWSRASTLVKGLSLSAFVAITALLIQVADSPSVQRWLFREESSPASNTAASAAAEPVSALPASSPPTEIAAAANPMPQASQSSPAVQADTSVESEPAAPAPAPIATADVPPAAPAANVIPEAPDIGLAAALCKAGTVSVSFPQLTDYSNPHFRDLAGMHSLAVSDCDPQSGRFAISFDGLEPGRGSVKRSNLAFDVLVKDHAVELSRVRCSIGAQNIAGLSFRGNAACRWMRKSEIIPVELAI